MFTSSLNPCLTTIYIDLSIGTNQEGREQVPGLYEKPRSGRPTKITNHKITEFLTNVKNGIFPKQLAHKIKKDTGVKYTESGIRDILHRHNFTPKVPDSTHKNKASSEQIEELCSKNVNTLENIC